MKRNLNMMRINLGFREAPLPQCAHGAWTVIETVDYFKRNGLTHLRSQMGLAKALYLVQQGVLGVT